MKNKNIEKIENLKQEKIILEKELITKEIESKEVGKLCHTLKIAERFAYDYWDKVKENNRKKMIEEIKNGEEFSYLWTFEYNIRESNESYKGMNLAIKNFEVIFKNFKHEFDETKRKVDKIEHEIKKEERKLLRNNLRKQGRELLKCGYSSQGVLGCFGDYPCQNCKTNYEKDGKLGEINN